MQNKRVHDCSSDVTLSGFRNCAFLLTWFGSQASVRLGFQKWDEPPAESQKSSPTAPAFDYWKSSPVCQNDLSVPLLWDPVVYLQSKGTQFW